MPPGTLSRLLTDLTPARGVIEPRPIPAVPLPGDAAPADTDIPPLCTTAVRYEWVIEEYHDGSWLPCCTRPREATARRRLAWLITVHPSTTYRLVQVTTVTTRSVLT